VLAVKILRDRTEKGLTLDSLFHDDDFLVLSAKDRRFSRELVQGVFRNLSLLDYFISQISSRKTNQMDSVVLWILRVALYQIEFMRVPDHASVYEAVSACKRFKKSSAQSFVNGILRAFLRSRPRAPQGTSSDALAIRYSHPVWLVKRYLNRYGSRQTESILRRNNETPESIVWVNSFKTSLQDFTDQLDREGIPHEVLMDIPNAVRITAAGFTQNSLYQKGHCFFMDASSQKVALFINLTGCRLIGDFCAAPGGKTFLIADRAEPQARILCTDLDRGRLNQLGLRALRYGVRGLWLVQMDWTQPAGCTRSFQSILMDVPCSGTGTFRSNPDARWGIRESDLRGFQARQTSLLQNGFSALQPGGELVYSTCSTEPEENEEVVESFLDSEPKSLLSGDYFRTFPTQQLGDGFFAARVRRI
jgi:16S rRNA (cytosine967-C5)-methyltransferase